MKINYNEKEKSLEIEDKIKLQYGLLYFLGFLNILNACLSLYNLNETQLKFMGFIWVILGVVSMLFVLFLFTTKSTSSKIPMDKIIGLHQMNSFGNKKKFSLKLANGKNRDLLQLKEKSEVEKVRKLFKKIGIKYI